MAGIKAFRDGETNEVAGFRAPDANTFVVELDLPNAAFISSISWPFYGILPESVLGTADIKTLNDHAFFKNPTVGMGPYRFVRYETDQYVELEKNPNYHSPVGFDRMFFKPVTTDVATAQLEKGEMQLVQISPTDVDRLKAMPSLKIDSKAGPGIILMAVNLDGPEHRYLQDKRVRQAMLHAIDREGIVNQVLGGHASITNTHVMGPPEAIPADLQKYEFNPERARALLREAGWNPDQVVKIQWIQGIRDRDATVQIVQSQLGAVGMKVGAEPARGWAADGEPPQSDVRLQSVRRWPVHDRPRQHVGAEPVRPGVPRGWQQRALLQSGGRCRLRARSGHGRRRPAHAGVSDRGTRPATTRCRTCGCMCRPLSGRHPPSSRTSGRTVS